MRGTNSKNIQPQKCIKLLEMERVHLGESYRYSRKIGMSYSGGEGGGGFYVTSAMSISRA